MLWSLFTSKYCTRVYTVRENQGEKGLFAWVRDSQGKSGKLAVVSGKVRINPVYTLE